MNSGWITLGITNFCRKNKSCFFIPILIFWNKKKYFQSFCRAWLRHYKIKITTSGSHTVGIMMDDYRNQVCLVPILISLKQKYFSDMIHLWYTYQLKCSSCLRTTQDGRLSMVTCQKFFDNKTVQYGDCPWLD